MAGMPERPGPIHKAVFALIIVTFIARIPAMCARYFAKDEFEHLHAARCVYHGLVPYRDFFEHHTPFLYYLLAPLYQVSGDTVTTLFLARAVMLLCAAGVLYLTYYLAKMLYDPTVALYAALFLSAMPVFLENGIEIRPDCPAVFFGLLSIILFISAARSAGGLRRYCYFFLTGLMASIAVLFTQKMVFLVLGLLIGLAWISGKRGLAATYKERIALLSAFSGGILFPVGATCLYFFMNKGLGDLIYRNFTMNLSWPHRPFKSLGIARMFSLNAFFFISSIAGILLAGIQVWGRGKAARECLVPIIVACALIAGIFILPVFYLQYFLSFIPLLSIYAAFLFNLIVESIWQTSQESKGSRRWALTGLSVVWCALYIGAPLYAKVSAYQNHVQLLGVTLFAASFFSVIVWSFLHNRRTLFTVLLLISMIVTPLQWILNERLAIDTVKVGKGRALRLRNDTGVQLREIKYILENSTSRDCIFDGWTGTGVFRDHAYYYYFMHGEIRQMLTLRELSDDILRALIDKRPKFVIYDNDVKQLPLTVTGYIKEKYAWTKVGRIYVLHDARQ